VLGERQPCHRQDAGGQADPAPYGPPIATAFQQWEHDRDQPGGEDPGGQPPRPRAAHHSTGGLILTLLGSVWTAPPDIGSQIRAAADRLAADGPITIESLGQLPTTKDRRTTPAAAVEDALAEETTDGAPLLRITSIDTPVPDKQFLFTITGTPDGGAFCLELTTTMPPTDRVTTGSSLFLPGQQATVAVPPTATGREAPVVAEVFEGACATAAHSAVRW
jgi:hypothetical protein